MKESETKDRFGLTADERADALRWARHILAEEDCPHRAIEAEAVSMAKVAAAVLSPPPLGVEVDALAAILAAADGHPIESRFRAGSRFPDGTEWQPQQAASDSDLVFRILPKPAPKPEPKWISAKEAAVALLYDRKAVRLKYSGSKELREWWYVPQGGYIGVHCLGRTLISSCSHLDEFVADSQWCIVNPDDGTPL